MHNRISHPANRTRVLTAAVRARGRYVVAAVVVACAAVTVTATPAWAAAPSRPTFFTVAAGPTVGNMSLHWRAPVATGGSAITSYSYQVQVDGTGAWSPSTTIVGGGAARSVVAPCPAAQTPTHGCAFRISANNPVASAFTTSSLVTWAVPDVPLMRFPVAGPSSAVTLSWRPPLNTGGATVGYQYDVNDGITWSGPNAIDLTTATQTNTPQGVVYSSAVGCSIATTSTTGCTYRMYAVNAIGSSPASIPRLAPLRVPGTVTGLSSATTSVALGTGDAAQTIAWSLPTSGGGLVVAEFKVFACSTSLGGACANVSPGWVQADDLVGLPPATTTTYQCPANGSCAYEVWALNAIGATSKSWRLASTHPAGATNLAVTADTSAAGQLALRWSPTNDVGAVFGNYVLWECDITSNCASGGWTNNPGDAAPWTRTDLPGTAASTTYHCNLPTACMFRVGYVDAFGNIGGVSNAVTATGLDAPTLTAIAGGVPGSVALSWSPPQTGPGATGFQIFRDTGAGFANLTVVGGGQTTFTDLTCGTGSTCVYKVRALYSVGTSADSAPKSVVAQSDTTPPIISLTRVNGAAQSFPYLTNATVTSVGGSCGTAAGDSSTVVVVLGGGASENGTTSCSAGTWSYTLLAPLAADGIDTVTATQSDAASNTGTTGTKTITVDATAPAVTVTSPQTNDVTTTTPAITGARGQASGDLATVTVNIYSGSTTAGTLVQTLTDTTAGSTWTVNPAALLPATTYTVQAQQTDAAGNVGSSAAITFSTA